MSLYAADLVTSGLTDVGYQQIADDKSEVVARTQTGVTELGSTGIYYVNAPTLGATTAALVWTSTGTASARAIGSVVDRDVDAILVDTGTTLDGRIPAALVGGRMDANMGAISGSATAADKLEASALTIIVDTIAAGHTETTTTLKGGGTASLDATDDHYNGRIIIFTSGVLINQATDITDYTGSTNLFTVTALTEAPADGDSFVIV